MHSLIAMSEAEAAIIKPEETPYVTVFVSEPEVANEDNEDPQVDSQQIIVHTGNSVGVEEYNDIHCVISHEHVNFESSENEDLSNDSNRTLWTRNNVKLLINEYKAMKHEFQDPRRKQKDLWATLAARLSERVAKEEGDANSWMASQVTWDACDRKWRNLKHTFKTIHTNQWRSFRSRSRWEFYNPLLEIFGNSIECRQPTKAEGTRYVVVHPPSNDGGKSILVPTTRKPASNTRQAHISQLSTLIDNEDGGSGEETMFVEEVKVDESTGGSYVVVKPSMERSSEPNRKRMKLPHMVHHVHGEVKVGDVQFVDVLSTDKGHGLHSLCMSGKSKDGCHLESSSNNENVVDNQEAEDNSRAPPLWFVNFLKEYQAEERSRREALKKAHEDIIRVEERKVKALESILSKLSSNSLLKSSRPSEGGSKLENKIL